MVPWFLFQIRQIPLFLGSSWYRYCFSLSWTMTLFIFFYLYFPSQYIQANKFYQLPKSQVFLNSLSYFSIIFFSLVTVLFKPISFIWNILMSSLSLLYYCFCYCIYLCYFSEHSYYYYLQTSYLNFSFGKQHSSTGYKFLLGFSVTSFVPCSCFF